MVISDISCDVHGSIELLTRSTTIDKPSFVFDPITSKEVTDCKNTHGVTIQGVDILPAELPLESSIHFGKAVLQVLDEIAKTKANQGSLDVSKLSPYLVRMF